MTLKITKSKVFTALIVALCVLATAFALVGPRGKASADEEAGSKVTWEYTTDSNITGETEWLPFNNGEVLFTYGAVDYSANVRAKIVTSGETAKTEYVTYKAGDTSGLYLTYSGEFHSEPVSTLLNATEYTATINGADEYELSDENKTVTFTISKRDVSADDFVDILGADEDNRLWLLQLSGSNTSALRDLATYYDPDADFSEEYGTNVTTGVLFNSYVRYTGKAHKIIINQNYLLQEIKLSDYAGSVTSIEYSTRLDGEEDPTSNPVTGEANKVNKIFTTAKITFNDNWAVADSAGNYLEITKEWYIVTINNALRTWTGDANAVIESWMYCDDISEWKPLRPEHGDNAVFTLIKEESVLARFAVKYTGESVLSSDAAYYDVKQQGTGYVIDLSKRLEATYYTDLLATLDVGAYSMNISVPAYTATLGHVHWWDDAEDESADIVYYPISRTFNLAVNQYKLTEDNVVLGADNADGISIKLRSNFVFYNGSESNIPEAVVTFRGETLVYDVDYRLQSPDIRVGKASLVIVGLGRFTDQVQKRDVYDILQTENSWQYLPSIMPWRYGDFDKEMNHIVAQPTYLDNNNDLWFKITTDRVGNTPAASALREFRLTNGSVSNDVAEALNALKVGTYYMFATVEASTNYKRLAQRGIEFKVSRGDNGWEEAPSIVSWKEGDYGAGNLPVAKSKFGTAVVVVKDSSGKEVYNSDTGLNNLKSAKAGVYTLTATVLGTSDYAGLDYSGVFTIFEQPGMPLWGTLLIIFGSLLLVAVILFILWKRGVFRFLTKKVLVDLRTQATVDATVAAIRANQKNEEVKKELAEAEEKEKAEAKKKERMEARKAKKDAEKLNAQSEEAQPQADTAPEQKPTEAAEQAPAEQPAAEQAPEAAEKKPAKKATGANTKRQKPANK
ncbi:MAG: hypothetical protein J1F69_00480 [Clostridiales bacterium]|nr:hypothetical protein [Clostridiales bacterium]